MSARACTLEWGRRGAALAAARGDALAIVDTLSFSTAVATAIDRGALIFPCAKEDDARALARRVGGEAAVHRTEVPAAGRFSLSPLTFLGAVPGTRVVLASDNGAVCCRLAREAACVFVGALVNAAAVATALLEAAESNGRAVAIVACGERWPEPHEEGSLRPAVEDYLGAGAILASLPLAKSPEARVCEAAFRGARADIEAIVWDCASGRELRALGFGEDARVAARLDTLGSAPVVRGERIEAWR